MGTIRQLTPVVGGGRKVRDWLLAVRARRREVVVRLPSAVGDVAAELDVRMAHNLRDDLTGVDEQHLLCSLLHRILNGYWAYTHYQ